MGSDPVAADEATVLLHTKLWNSLSSHAPTIYDVGANRGDFAARYLDRFTAASLHAFEPNPTLVRELHRRFEGRITVHAVAVGSESSVADFHITADDRTSSFLVADPHLLELADSYRILETAEVRLTTLDLVSAEVGAPDILKIDTEGYELEVLRGASRLLRDQAPSIVSCEVRFATAYTGQVPFHQLASHLADAGYLLHSFSRLEHTSRGYLYFGDATWLSEAAWHQLGYL